MLDSHKSTKMSLINDSHRAVNILGNIQAQLHSQGIGNLNDDLTSIMYMLNSPVFHHIINLLDSVDELKQVLNSHHLSEDAYNFTSTGELVLNLDDGISETIKYNSASHPTGTVATEEYNQEIQKTIERAAQGRKLINIQLYKPENGGLGFSVVGMKDVDKDNLGIFIQGIQPLSVAASDGRLQEGDQILAIDGQPLDFSHKAAIELLQSARGSVELVVARGPSNSQLDGSAVNDPNKEEKTPAHPLENSASVAISVNRIETQIKESLKQANEQSASHPCKTSTDMVLNTDWIQIEVIDLINDGTGLGFGIFGGKSTGVVVKTILPGGVADTDSRLRSGDHILQIGDFNVRGMSSEQVASVLRQSGSHVRLIVARAIIEPPLEINYAAPIVPTQQLDERLQQLNTLLSGETEQVLDYIQLMQNQHEIQERLIAANNERIEDQQAGREFLETVQVHQPPEDEVGENPEMEMFEVKLVKDSQGLGITIVGYVAGGGAPDELSGIYVQSIAEGSAAHTDGNIQVNDQIIEVDGKSLHGFSNHDAVKLLQQTDQTVILKLIRYKHGPKYDQLQQYLAQVKNPLKSATVTDPIIPPPSNIDVKLVYDAIDKQLDISDVNLYTGEQDYSGNLLPEAETAIKATWEPIVGNDFEVVVAQLSKFREGGGLGISLEGTVDVENGVEVRPHHYIRSILPDGPVGVNGQLIGGDELLEVNGKRLLGLNHKEIVSILKELPQHVRLVCARRKKSKSENYSNKEQDNFSSPPLNLGVNPNSPSADRLIKAKSEVALSSQEWTAERNNLNRTRSRSLEPLTGLAMWSSEPVIIELKKQEKGLGFSILDYQDPVNPAETVIVIRSLVPGGVAQLDGRLLPGDRLVFVNDVNLENATLDDAVQTLKGAPKGTVLIGVAKPLPLTVTLPQSEATIPSLNAPFVPLSPTHATCSSTAPSSSSPPTPLLPSQSSPISVSPPTIAATVTTIDTTPSIGSIGQQTIPPFSSVSPLQHAHSSEQSYQAAVTLEVRKAGLFTSLTEESKTDSEQIGKHTSPPDPAPSPSAVVLASSSPVTPPTSQPIPFFEIKNEEIHLSKSSSLLSLTRKDSFYEDDETEEALSVTVVKPNLGTAPLEFKGSESLDKAECESFPTLPSTPPPPLPPTTPPPLAPLDILNVSESGACPEDMKVNLKAKLSCKKSESVESSSSSEHFTPSDLKAFSSPSSTPRTMSPRMSPLLSPSPIHSIGGSVESLPSTLEKTIKIKKGQEQLGITVDAIDKGANGCVVKSISPTGAIGRDGRIAVGDYIVSINNESMRRITNAQSRAILRRAALLGIDINVTYITSSDATTYKETAGSRTQEFSPTHSAMPSPNSNLSPIHLYGAPDGRHSAHTSPMHSPLHLVKDKSASAPASPAVMTGSKSIGRQITLSCDGSPATGDHTWGPPRAVILERESGKSLGISIVGGRINVSHTSPEQMMSGIFIKVVMKDSPAGRDGTLKTGDRILEVNNKDLRTASHDEAVEIIRKAANPVHFLVQSLTDASCPIDVDDCSGVCTSWKTADSHLTVEPLTTDHRYTSIIDGYLHQVSHLDVQEPTLDKVFQDEEEMEIQVCDEYGYSIKKLQHKYGDLNGDIVLVDLNRGNNGLGISLAGNKDRSKMSVYVAGVQPGSPAFNDGRIRVGDELLEVNGQVLYGRSHLNASAIIKGLTQPVLKVVLLRSENYLEHMAVKPLKLLPATSDENESYQHEDSIHSVQGPSNIEIRVPTEDTTPAMLLQDIVQVVINKGPSGFGFTTMEDKARTGMYIKSITPGSAVAQGNLLSVGDRILEIDRHSLENIDYGKAMDILKKTQGKVKLKVQKQRLIKKNEVSVNLGDVGGDSTTDPISSAQKASGPLSDPLTCAIVPGTETYLEIDKGRSGLGLSIVGGADTLLGSIIIHEVYADGAAHRDGRLMAGDQILVVNDENLKDATHERAIQILRQTPTIVKMVVYRDDQLTKEEDIYDIFTVELVKKPGKGLGLSIVGKRNDVGVYISDIVRGGVSEADGRLMQGDQILAVNDEDMRRATQDHAAAVLKMLMGKVVLTIGRLKASSRSSSHHNSSSGGLRKSESHTSGKSKGKHSRVSSEDISHVRIVEVAHDARGSLGLSIAGGVGSTLGDTPVVITNLHPGGPAALSEKLKIGDQILAVNEMSTKDLTHTEVVAMLKDTSTPVILTVTHGEERKVSVNGQSPSRPPSEAASFTDEAIEELLESHHLDDLTVRLIVLERGPEGLGFSIVGGHGSPHGDLPIYVKTVCGKGAASVDGQLKRGDRIQAVNGTSLDGVTHDEAVTILKNAQGKVTLTVSS